MLILENIKLAFAALRANKMRALLTMLGIIIGIGSVIAIMTVSSSLTTSISTSFQEMGANNITVGIKQISEESEVRKNGMKFGAASRTASAEEEDLITDEMVSELKAAFPQKIDAVAIQESVADGTVKVHGNSASVSVSGVNEDYFKSSDVTLLAGRRIKAADLDGNKKVMMVSDKAAEQIFDGDVSESLSKKVSVEMNGVYTDYYVVGVYKYEQSGQFSSSDEDVATAAYIPLTTAKEQIRGKSGYTQLTVVTVAGLSELTQFTEEIEQFFEPYYRGNDTYEIATSTMESMTESMNDMIETVSIAISFIAGISLLVGGIGVMNIMLVSITERTREIGTRKALGAKNSSIRLQFIVESTILCMVGGCLGIAAGVALGAVAAGILGYAASAPVTAIFMAVGFSMVIGIFFGCYPAGKAARMNPIDALRCE